MAKKNTMNTKETQRKNNQLQPTTIFGILTEHAQITRKLLLTSLLRRSASSSAASVCFASSAIVWRCVRSQNESAGGMVPAGAPSLIWAAREPSMMGAQEWATIWWTHILMLMSDMSIRRMYRSTRISDRSRRKKTLVGKSWTCRVMPCGAYIT